MSYVDQWKPVQEIEGAEIDIWIASRLRTFLKLEEEFVVIVIQEGSKAHAFLQGVRVGIGGSECESRPGLVEDLDKMLRAITREKYGIRLERVQG